MEAQRRAIAMLDRVDIVLEALGKNLLFVGARKARLGFRLSLFRWDALVAPQRPGTLHCAAKLVDVFLVHSRYSVRVSNTNQDFAPHTPA